MTNAQLAKTGDTIEVYWPDDETYYAGRITGYQNSTGRHSVEYFDGDIENLDLSNELWRPVAKASPRAVTTQHLGAILQNAAQGSSKKRLRKTITKKRHTQPKSPVSVLQTAPRGVCASCLTRSVPISPRLLIAHIVTRWLRDETRRPSTPVKQSAHALWVQICTDLCVRYAHDWLLSFSHDSTASVELCDSDSEVGWMLDVCGGKSIELAVRNYDAWERPLTIDEWHIERDIMRAVSQRFARAAFSTISDTKRSSLEAARLHTATALKG